MLDFVRCTASESVFVNYLSHGYRFLDTPLFLAGTAVPDWLSVVNRKVRARKRLVEPVVAATTSDEVRQIGLGILQHHQDDDIFHRCALFQQLEGELGREFRRHMPDKYDHRPGFLGHIVVELLLDDVLSSRDETLLDRFYAAIKQVDTLLVESCVNLMSNTKTDKLAWFIDRFLEEQFLYDYADDRRLFMRLNQVLKRVKLPVMDDTLLQVLPIARELVNERADLLFDTVIAGGLTSEGSNNHH